MLMFLLNRNSLVSEKTEERSLRYLKTDKWTDHGRKDHGQTDKGDYKGPLRITQGSKWTMDRSYKELNVDKEVDSLDSVYGKITDKVSIQVANCNHS